MNINANNSVSELIKNYNPKCKEEAVYKIKILQFLAKNINCFDRSNEKGHITASAWLLNNDKTKALILHHSKLDIWVQPGGHCDGCTDPLYVAIKEAKEESGLKSIVPVSNLIFDLDIHEIPESKKEKKHLHYDIRFILKSESDDTLNKNHESKELKWIEYIEDIPTNNKSIYRMFSKWKSISSYS